MKRTILNLIISGAIIAACLLLANLLESETIYKGLVSVSAVASLYFIGNLVLMVICLIGETKEKTGNIYGNVKLNKLLKKVNAQRDDNIDENKMKKLFSVSAKDLMIGEKIMNSQGIMVRKKSDIKNLLNRCAAELQIDLNFAINIDNGEVFKVLKYAFEEKEVYYKIEYNELNRCMEMNESARAKYKSITEENWQIAINKQ